MATKIIAMRVPETFYNEILIEARTKQIAIQDVVLGRLSELEATKQINTTLIDGIQVYSQLHFKELSENDKRKHEPFFKQNWFKFDLLKMGLVKEISNNFKSK